jgi:hypothetical protein
MGSGRLDFKKSSHRVFASRLEHGTSPFFQVELVHAVVSLSRSTLG